MTASVGPRPPALAPLMGPLLLELGLGLAIGVVGTLLAARGGDDQAAAFALGHQMAGLLFVLLRVVGAGISVVVAQHLGAGQRARAAHTAQASVQASVVLGLALAAIAALPAALWMQLLQAPETVAPQATRFLWALAPALALDALVSAQCSILRAHLRAGLTLQLNAWMQGVHLLVAWFCMGAPGLEGSVLGGAFGRIDWGLEGFALGMVLSRVLAITLAIRWDGDLGLPPLPWRRAQWTAPLREILEVGLPAAAENILYRVCATVGVAVAGSLGATTLAAQAYAFQFNMLTMLPGCALGLSMEVLVGHAVGQGRLRQAHRLLLRSLAVGLVVSVVLATAVAWSATAVLGAFTRDAAVAQLVLTALWWTVALEPGRTFNIVVINGLRAAGDTRFPVMAGAISMLVVLAGGSVLLGSQAGLGWGLTGIWVAYAADEWVRGLIMWWRWQHLHWVPHARALVRSRRRQKAESAHQPV